MAISPRLCLLPILDTNGVPISGAKVYIYAAGTTTPLSLYTDNTLSTGADNPIIATQGFVPLRFMATASYKIVVTTSAGAAVTGYDGDNIDPGVAIGSGALAIANGGTASTTAAAARTALAAAASTDMATAQSDISNLQTWSGYNLTTQTKVANGTTAQRPGSPTFGIRWNSTTSRYETHDGSNWYNVLTSEELAAQSDMETPSSGTLVVSPLYMRNHPGVAKAWAYVTISGGTPTLQASHNIASITDNGVGDITLTYTTAMSTALYCAIAQFVGIDSSAAAGPAANVKTLATGSARVQVLQATNSSTTTSIAVDTSFVFVAFGDFA
jgi:hypothetical protein